MFELVRVKSAEDLAVLPESEQLALGCSGGITRDEHGMHTAKSAAGMTVCIREQGGGQGRMFLRRAIKFPPDRPSFEVSALVAELDGVRVYVDEERQTIIVTREELQL